ncbi:DUF1385 domain-containing protein [uncultured Fusobacterium sp.]|uniref:DUF1385 domain-containing protein n=1 Tax=uncultured Fusobacterium sp. TaxID=159267 RepID=UPI002597A225|nr:DUF1385 domain-containing protein [uncultured Fusobacterium sp.]
MKEKLSIGGQAVIEGVMMRSPFFIATAVRKPSGEIVYKRTKISKKRSNLEKLLFIRGAVMLFDALTTGIKELTFSANQSEDKEEEQISQKEAVLTTIFSLGLGIALFVVIPSIIGSLLFQNDKVHANLVEAILRLLFFVLYIWLISFSKEVKRVYQYHGAEHKSIYAYEKGLELTPANAKQFTTLHPRCGTSFLLIVMLIAIIVFSTLDFIFPTPVTIVGKLSLKVGLRVLLMPLIAGISYEIQRYSAKHLDNIFVKILAMPGLWLQKITTKEPDMKQLEVAIVAIKASLGEIIENATEIDK